MSNGASFHSFAGRIRVSRAVLYKWEKEYPEFKEAKEIAFDACLYFWEVKGIRGMEKQFFKSGVWVHNMKARFKKDGWNTAAAPEEESGDFEFEYADEN